ncbi:aldo-keto reductase family 1 member A1-like isoform X2 [Rhodnius prolixus]|uniref:aldo-keto reductase family 1 member A1-like isoform X2 n=1 Tax=Rhodnius prolixus TaxID=13249 RepID=UPI003D18A1F2
MTGLTTATNLTLKVLNKRRYPAISQTRNNFFKKLFGKKKSSEYDSNLTPCSRIETRGMSMPMIGIGTWQVEPDCIESVITCALTVGYRHIDTSHSYGNQAAIGATLDSLFKGGKFCRNEIFISSKLPYYGMKPEEICNYVTDALNCLCLQYIDLFMIQFPVGIKEIGGNYIADPDTNHILIWKALEEEVKKDRIKSLGLSNFNMRQISTLMECANIPPANLQVEMHLYLQQKELITFCSQHCIGMTAYAPLGSPGLDQYLMKNSLQPASVPSIFASGYLSFTSIKQHLIVKDYQHQNGSCVEFFGTFMK